MHFNQLLETVGVDPAGTLVLRHRPKEKELLPIIARMAQEQPELFNAYQSWQDEPASKALRKAHHVAAFLGQAGNSAVFAGIYEMRGYSTRTTEQLMRMPGLKALIELGMSEPQEEAQHWHDLALTDHLTPFRFSLAIGWRAPRSWFLWADRHVFEIRPSPVHEEIRVDMPEWDKLDLSWGMLNHLPPSWRGKLEEWRGIYCIFDTASKQAYVGAAYGEDNLMGRWLNYAKSGHGGNKLLRARDAKYFRFSILQRVSPDMEAGEVLDLEASWKRRLHTREYGLNEN